MSKHYTDIINGLTEAIAYQRLAVIEHISIERLVELSTADREGRILICQYPACGGCKYVSVDMYCESDPCKSCYERAIAKFGKGEI